MGKTLNEIAQELKNSNKKVQLIYAFNGTGKTRLSKEFKALVDPKSETDDSGLNNKKILYYNAFTEDLFYWDNDLEKDARPKLKIHPNIFTKWVFEDQGQDSNVIRFFQHYADKKLNPNFNAQYISKDKGGKDIIINAFTEVTFSYGRGNDEKSDDIKISKGEESCFIWSVFYSLLEQVVNVLNVAEESDRETDQFDNLEYVFIDDPVTSLDENHLIRMAVDLSDIIKKSESDLKFIITTHNPLFYNVLSNDFNNSNKEIGYNKDKHFKKYCLIKNEDSSYELNNSNDSPFSYHLFLLNEVGVAVETGKMYKYHFNFLRNILEKTSTFLGYEKWEELLYPIKGESQSYMKRILNLSSHSKHSAEEIVELTESDKLLLRFLLEEIKGFYRFK
jgi:hypothetical protein